MSNALINIDELHREKEIKMKNKLDIYENILKKCHFRIKSTAKLISAPNCCFFIVPRYIYGSPLYDINQCIMFLIQSLNNNGFEVLYTNPNLLYISWEGKKNPKNFKVLQKREKGYKSIEDYKPTGNFVYDKKTIDIFKNKLNNL